MKHITRAPSKTERQLRDAKWLLRWAVRRLDQLTDPEGIDHCTETIKTFLEQGTLEPGREGE